MQQGFSFVELLLASLFSCLLLLAASQNFASLAKFQLQLNSQLQMNEAAILADLAIQNTLHQASGVFLAGQASSTTSHTNSSLKINLGASLGELTFTQLKTSDWLLLVDKHTPNKFNLLHLDNKTYGKGLSYKSYRPDEVVAERSDTLVDLISQLTWRFYQPASQQWLTPAEVSDFSQVSAVSYFLTFEAPVLLAGKPSYWHLTKSFNWGENQQETVP